jgi:hypothetical protein
MDKKDFYRETITQFDQKEEYYRKKASRFPLFRLLTFVGGIVLFYVILPYGLGFSIGVLIIFLMLFAWVMRVDFRLKQQLNFYQSLKQINKDELKSLEGNSSHFQTGSEYLNKDHHFASDLDIFGQASIYQYFCRTLSKPGSDKLADMLLQNTSAQEIRQRQEAIKELAPKIQWRQEFIANGILARGQSADPQKLTEWLTQASFFSSKKWMIGIIHIMPVLTISAVIASFYGIPNIVPVTLVIIQGFIINKNSNQITFAYHNLSGKVGLLNNYSALIKTIEKEKFETKKLSGLQEVFFLNRRKASENLKYLSSVVGNLDLRHNIYFHIPLNLLTFWDIHWLIKAEKWRENNKENLQKWFNAMAEFEALASFANAYFNNPEWTFPEITDSFEIEAKEAGHPLIPHSKRVVNDFSVNGGKLMLVTGSNMAGKSTFLRTAGVNMILAMAGSAVCASYLKVPLIKVFTSMRIADSLEDNTSSFYAELKRLNALIQLVKNEKNIFYLLDEILRGTNSNDRHIGSIALIRQLSKMQSTGMIATHDLELAKLEEEMKGDVENYHFDVQIDNDRLYFDYKLHHGVCKSLNASILMKNMGIEI